jgi:transcriptional regulator with XRE-family HTH domain
MDLKLGMAVRLERTMRGISRRKLAAEANISESWASKIEREGKLPSSDVLDRIAEVLGVTAEEIKRKAVLL